MKRRMTCGICMLLMFLLLSACTKEKKQQADLESAAAIGTAMSGALASGEEIREEIRPFRTGYIFAMARGGEPFFCTMDDEEAPLQFVAAVNQALGGKAPDIAYTEEDNGWKPYRWGIAVTEKEECVVAVMDEAGLRFLILYPIEDGEYPISVVEKKEEVIQEGPVGDGFWVNFEEIPFYVNDRKYVLGINTLSDMVKDGIPVFDASAEGAGSLLSPGEKSDRFSVRLANGWGVNLYTMNTEEKNRQAVDCIICEVNLIMDTKEMKENRLSFNFPLELTPEKLRATAGDPSKLEHYDDDKLGDVYDTFIYLDSARKSVSQRSYTFKFTNDELMVVELSFRP